MPAQGLSFHNSVLCNIRMWQIRYEDEDEDEGPQPDQTLEQGLPIPVRLQGSFPPELASTPLEDIDPFYSNQMVSHFYEPHEKLHVCLDYLIFN